MCCFSCQGPGNSGRGYPTRPLTYIVPWSPGGGTDMSARAMASALQQALGQPINVVNRTGGGGVVGHLALSQGPTDGYTIGAITVEITMMHWMGLTDLTYQDFQPLALLMNNAATITVRKDAPWNTLEEFVADLTSNPGEYQASGTSKGGIWDLARIGFLQTLGLPENAMPWVPSQGAAPAMQELLAGGVDVVTAALAEVDALRQAGEVRVLGVMSDERLPQFPDVPTLKEQGIDWSQGGWVGLGAPAGLPQELVLQLDSALQVAFSDTAFTKPMERAGYQLQYMNAEEFGAFMESQDQINGNILQTAGLQRNP